MAKMFIANCTKYKQIFAYRVPGSTNSSFHELNIPMLGQEQLPHDLPESDLRKIAADAEHFGMLEDKDVHNVKGFNGMIFRIGKPVDMDRVQHVHESNMEHLDSGVIERMKATLIASDQSIKAETGEEDQGAGQLEVIEMVEKHKAAGLHKGAIMAGKKPKK